ncbi:glycosyltransferase family 2 protein [Pisciglobus halotolerans]|uniref:Glycosyltransferase involved in cell wall bisynthesis n=1 Tax=Pisciglobus halotolerans TaxID=745365 RepID=A0A1I3CPP3_9LACT|nr:glycosyltransferase family 2 protein [Pisciglobus halotolerans]SFH76550.1 Glycosyltransferase involved in cell wall bisynthesis [Pisciglobus halotolerans]
MAKIFPYFSIVMPAYNCENTIGKTIESILKQTFENFELIIVNDGSIDSTIEVVQLYSYQDSRIRYITIPNNGPGNARNEGINIANGKYLLMIDADDAIHPKTLASYAELLKEPDIDLVISSYLMNVMDGMEKVDQKKIVAPNQVFSKKADFLESIYFLMDKQLMYVIWNKVYRLDIIKQFAIKFPPYKSCEDRLFNIAYYKHVNKALSTEQILYHYSFDGKNSLTNKFLINKFDTFVEFYRELLKLTKLHKEGSSALFLKGVMSCIIPIHSKDCPFNYKQKRQYIKTILHHSDVELAVKIGSTDSTMRKVMAWLFKSKNVFLVYTVSKVLYLLSTLSPKVIEKLKGNF